jgi:hypothetical protein
MRLVFRDIQEVEEVDGPKIVLWFDIVEPPPDFPPVFRYSMPADIFEHRLAEYGPMSEDELMEIVVAEGAMLLGSEGIGAGLHSLVTAPSRSVARKDHLSRCAQAKLRYRISTKSGAKKLSEELKSKIRIDQSTLQSKRTSFRAALRRSQGWED